MTAAAGHTLEHVLGGPLGLRSVANRIGPAHDRDRVPGTLTRLRLGHADLGQLGVDARERVNHMIASHIIA